MPVYRPFLRPAARHAMAIKALDPADWLELGTDFAHQMQARRKLLDQRPNDVLASLPGSEAGQAELLALLLAWLQRHAGDRYIIEADATFGPDAVFGTGAVVERDTGLSISRSGASPPPLEVVGRLVQEDFCILQRGQDGSYRLTAAVLCFPAHWSLAEKIGRPLIDIHAPVPGFAEQLGDPVQRLFDRLTPEKPVQRLNWSLVDTDRLYLPPSHRTEPVRLDEDQVGDRIRLRIERQTLRRLPVSGDIVFGIRTYVTPLVQAVDTADSAQALIQRLHELPEPMGVYKNVAAIREPLLAFLEARRSSLEDGPS